jgi:hypothetical protein
MQGSLRHNLVLRHVFYKIERCILHPFLCNTEACNVQCERTERSTDLIRCILESGSPSLRQHQPRRNALNKKEQLHAVFLSFCINDNYLPSPTCPCITIKNTCVFPAKDHPVDHPVTNQTSLGSLPLDCNPPKASNLHHTHHPSFDFSHGGFRRCQSSVPSMAEAVWGRTQPKDWFGGSAQ